MSTDEIARGASAILIAVTVGGLSIWSAVRAILRIERTSVADLRADRLADRALIAELRADVARAEAKVDAAEAEISALQVAHRDCETRSARLEAEIATLKINIRELGDPGLSAP